MVRRRWRRLYGDIRANNSIKNFFYMFGSYGLLDYDKEIDRIRGVNFRRDFSAVFVPNFIFIFLYTRAVTATENMTGITASPWGDLWATLGLTFVITIPLMIVTSMFDYVLSIIWGD
jgi:hypothetical protein